MDMDLLVPLSAIGVMMIVAVTAILARTISQHKLKVEQIKADAMVRVEEARIRNQIELEKLMQEERAGSTDRTGISAGRSALSNEELQMNDAESRQRSRVRD
jgi:hypothetical protein